MSTSNKKRCFTIMIVPHSEEATYSLRIPLYAVQAVVALLVLGVTGLCVLGYAYLNVAAEAREAEALRQLNRAQQEEIDSLAVETQLMMEQVHAIDELVEMVTEKLEIEVSDLGDNVQTDLEELLQNQSSGSPVGSNGIVYNSVPNLANSPDPLYSLRIYESRSSGSGVLDRAAGNLALLASVVPERTEVLDSVDAYVDKVDAIPSIWPARGRLSSGFGTRRIPYASGYQFHTGVDIIGARGSSIMATAPGRVTFAAYRGSFGNLVIINHGHGYETHYAHLSGFNVRAGDQVERGDTVGYMGATGRTTGTHLHYEVHRNGSPVNPANYMKHK